MHKLVLAGLPVALALLLAACSGAARPVSAPTVTSALTPTAGRSAPPVAPAPSAPGGAARNGTPPVQLGGAVTPASAAAPLPPAGQVLLRQSGGGGGVPTVNLQTGSFTSPGSWDLNWSYTCGSSPPQGNLTIDVYTTSGRFIANPPSLDQVGNGGQGTQQYNIGGTFTLNINSVCQWSVTAVTAARPTATPTITAAVAATASAANVSAVIAAVPTRAAAATAGAGTTGSVSLGGGTRGVGRAIPTPAPVVPAAVSNPLTGGAFTTANGAAAAATAAAGTGAAGASGAAVATITPVAAATRSPASAGSPAAGR
jgi:hypothetical protein